MRSIVNAYNSFNKLTSHADGLPLLLLRLYLAPVMIQAGWTKHTGFENIVEWFGNAEWGLGLPLPTLMAALATYTELVGGVLLLFGLLTRVVSLPLMITMLVAMFTVHAKQGWLAIADANSWFANGTIFYNDAIMSSTQKLAAAKSLLQEHGHYEWLTSSGNFVILNNGIEFAATYFVMLLVLAFYGGGRYLSVDYWIVRDKTSTSD